MNLLKATAENKPVLFTLLLVIACITTLYSTMLLNIENIIISDLVSSSIKNLITLFLIFIILHCNWLQGSQLNTPFKQWQPKWWLATLPMALIALLNVTSVDWSLLTFSTTNTLAWLYTNISTGLFEEIMLRGVCFYVLYQAWQNKSNGLVKAALCQALIFGLAHYVNLTKAPFAEVSIQVTYATLIGIGFAGLVAYTRSLWPAIIVHSLINSLSSMNIFFQQDFTAEPMNMTNYLVVIVIIGLLAALPGYLLLKKKQSQLPLSLAEA